MHKLLFPVTLVVIAWAHSPAQAQTARTPGARKLAIFSQTSIEKGWKQATAQQQPMLVMFTSDNCLYCKKMLAETYGHPTIKQMLAANTQTVLAHADNYQDLVKKLGIRGYPSSVLVSPKGDVLDFMEGFVSPQDFAKRVHPLLQAHARQARAQNPADQTTER
jgi:thioredoxin-related protein